MPVYLKNSISHASSVPVFMDGDPGIDDAVAWLMAMAVPEYIHILGFGAVVGNTPLHHVQRHGRWLCDLAGRQDISVYSGCPRPMGYTLYDEQDSPTDMRFGYVASIHGHEGTLGSVTVPQPKHSLAPEHAVEKLISLLRHAPQPLTIIATGPLTNIASALIMAPDIQQNIEHLIVMGGSLGKGNITPFAEYNFFVDPWAAAVVMGAGLSLTLIGLNITHQVAVTPAWLDRLKAVPGPVASLAVEMIGNRAHETLEAGIKGLILHDPTTVAFLLKPDLFKVTPGYGHVIIEGEERGRSVLTLDGQGKTPYPQDKPLNVVTEIDVEGFFELVFHLLARYAHRS